MKSSPPARSGPHLARAAPADADNPLPAVSEQELDALQTLIESLPADRDALDVTMIDGYLCGVLLQPRPVPEAAWLALITDLDGKPPPRDFPLARLHDPVRRRFRELAQAIHERDWFDPWVYPEDDAESPSDTVLPWVAGFAAAVDHFTELMDRHEDALLEPLALLYRHLDPDDLEDADELLAEIETYEPPATLEVAVEDLVRAVLLAADVSRPKGGDADSPRRGAPRGRGPSRGAGRPGPGSGSGPGPGHARPGPGRPGPGSGSGRPAAPRGAQAPPRGGAGPQGASGRPGGPAAPAGRAGPRGPAGPKGPKRRP